MTPSLNASSRPFAHAETYHCRAARGAGTSRHGRSLTGVFFGTAFATILTPGPNMVYVGTTGGERGPPPARSRRCAVVLGGVCYTLATAIGISAAMAAIRRFFSVIRGAGIVYLVYLGVKQLNRAARHARSRRPLTRDYAPRLSHRPGHLAHQSAARDVLSRLPAAIRRPRRWPGLAAVPVARPDVQLPARCW